MTDPWKIIAYEVRMFRATYQIVLDQAALDALPKVLANSVEESAVLHTRILCDVLLSNAFGADDIQLSRLLPGWRHNAKYLPIKAKIAKLRDRYGTASAHGSDCWIFNKMMAHPTKQRGVSYDYTAILGALRPVIEAIIGEIESLRGTQFTWSW